LQHPFTQKPSPNELIVLSLYEGSKTHPTYKLIGRYQPETKHRVMGPIGEKLTGVLISGNIYEMPTIGSMNKKVIFSNFRHSILLNDTFRYSWNAFSEETDAIYKKEFEQLKKKETKEQLQKASKLISRCGKGTRRNKVTGNCDPVGTKRTSSPIATPATPVKRCPNGTRRNKVTKKCEQK